MSYKVELARSFRRSAKRLLSKYPSLKADLSGLNAVLAEHPTTGTPLGADRDKIRLATRSKGRGKSGGARVTTVVIRRRRGRLPSHDLRKGRARERGGCRAG